MGFYDQSIDMENIWAWYVDGLAWQVGVSQKWAAATL